MDSFLDCDFFWFLFIYVCNQLLIKLNDHWWYTKKYRNLEILHFLSTCQSTLGFGSWAANLVIKTQDLFKKVSLLVYFLKTLHFKAVSKRADRLFRSLLDRASKIHLAYCHHPDLEEHSRRPLNTSSSVDYRFPSTSEEYCSRKYLVVSSQTS